MHRPYSYPNMQGSLDGERKIVGRLVGPRCPACDNAGIVAVELEGLEYGAPCPWCKLGELRNEQSAERPEDRFWSRHPITRTTWNTVHSIDGSTICRDCSAERRYLVMVRLEGKGMCGHPQPA